MKTTLEIPDSLLSQARKIAARDGITLQALVERGLRQVVAEKKQQRLFKLRRASFKGNGLRPELKEATWEDIREISYENRGA
jgi:hypothetical protein